MTESFASTCDLDKILDREVWDSTQIMPSTSHFWIQIWLTTILHDISVSNNSPNRLRTRFSGLKSSKALLPSAYTFFASGKTPILFRFIWHVFHHFWLPSYENDSIHLIFYHRLLYQHVSASNCQSMKGQKSISNKLPKTGGPSQPQLLEATCVQKWFTHNFLRMRFDVETLSLSMIVGVILLVSWFLPSFLLFSYVISSGNALEISLYLCLSRQLEHNVVYGHQISGIHRTNKDHLQTINF